MKVDPSRNGGSNYKDLSSTALKEKMRFGYNAHTKTFGPMATSETKKIEHMENVEGKVSKFPVPTDYTSPTFLQKVAPKSTAKGSQLESDTKGMRFIAGDSSLYTNFISNVTKAQDLI